MMEKVFPNVNIRKLVLMLLLVSLGACRDKTDSEKIAADSILFESVSVIDASSGMREDQYVLISGNKIVEVSDNPIQVPAGTMVIDGEGKFLIPGLWDAHVHLTFTPELEESMFRLFLGNGITSIRDTGGLLHKLLPWKEKSIREPNSSPRVFMAGPLLDGEPNVYDGSAGRPEISIGLENEEEAKAMVDSLAAAGVDLIKSYEMLSPAMFMAILQAADSHELPVTGHIPLSMDLKEASTAGLRSMEHMRNLEMAISADSDSLLEERRKMLAAGKDSAGAALRSQIHTAQRLHAIRTFDKDKSSEVLRILQKNGTWQIPTMALLTGGLNRLYEDAGWRETFESLPAAVRSQWMESAAEASEIPSSELSTAHGEWALKMIPLLKEAGLEVMAGTDTPIAYLTPGYSLHKELEMLVKGGMEPLEALESATLLPAKYFQVQDSIGTIDKNMIADLVLLDANPLDDIKNTRKIRAVVRNGSFYNRQALDSLLNAWK